MADKLDETKPTHATLLQACGLLFLSIEKSSQHPSRNEKSTNVGVTQVSVTEQGAETKDVESVSITLKSKDTGCTSTETDASSRKVHTGSDSDTKFRDSVLCDLPI